MAETCPLLDGQLPTDQDDYVVNKDLPESCLRCLYAALYGQFGHYMLEAHAKDPELAPSQVGIKPIDATISQYDGTKRDRHGVINYAGAPDTLAFACNIEHEQSDAGQEMVDIEAVKNMSVPEQVVWLVANFGGQTLQQACDVANTPPSSREIIGK